MLCVSQGVNMVFGGNGAIVILPILLAVFTLVWCTLGSKEKVKLFVCSANLLLFILLFLQVFFKPLPIAGEPLALSLVLLSFSMLISPIGVLIYGRYKNT